MTPIYLNPSPSPFPPVEPSEVQQLLFGDQPTSQAASSSSSISCPIFFSPSVQDQVVSYDSELQQQEEADKYVLSSDLQFLPISPSPPTVETHESNYGLKLSICNKREDKNGNHSYNGSVKWMSSKMRLMKKMMKSSNGMVTEKPIRSKQKFHDQQRSPSSLDTDNNSNNNTIIRVCTDCNTTKTPLWRSGPSGPKSLCNACGIRQRKARRAMAAAATATATAASGTLPATETSSTVHRKEKVSNDGCIAQYKKRCKLTVPPQSSKKLCFEDFTISLSKNSAFHRVFPQDEKEAAILLMALSCGLVHG